MKHHHTRKKHSNPEKYWRLLANLWLMATVFIIIIDFWSGGQYSFLISPVSILYITLLTVYIGSKEFQRWFSYYQGHHPGEVALVIWTCLMFILITSNAFLGASYHISQEIISTYLAVIALFVASRGSRAMHNRSHHRR